MHLNLHGLPNCLGFVDGSLLPLFRKPTVQVETYWDHYSLNMTWIVDAESRLFLLLILSSTLEYPLQRLILLVLPDPPPRRARPIDYVGRVVMAI